MVSFPLSPSSTVDWWCPASRVQEHFHRKLSFWTRKYRWSCAGWAEINREFSERSGVSTSPVVFVLNKFIQSGGDELPPGSFMKLVLNL